MVDEYSRSTSRSRILSISFSIALVRAYSAFSVANREQKHLHVGDSEIFDNLVTTQFFTNIYIYIYIPAQTKPSARRRRFTFPITTLSPSVEWRLIQSLS